MCLRFVVVYLWLLASWLFNVVVLRITFPETHNSFIAGHRLYCEINIRDNLLFFATPDTPLTSTTTPATVCYQVSVSVLTALCMACRGFQLRLCLAEAREIMTDAAERQPEEPPAHSPAINIIA